MFLCSFPAPTNEHYSRIRIWCKCKILDPCLVKYCGNGEECVVIKGKAVCICQRQCPKIRKVICGSDGKLYSNHCELHRAACLTAKPLFIDHSFSCSANLGKYFILPNKILAFFCA